MRPCTLIFAILTLAAISAAAQIRPTDPDDFIDPRESHGSVFISRLVLGATRSSVDDYHPLHQDTGFLLLANAFYWSNFQFDYKHSEVRGEHANDVKVCPCKPPIYFPTSFSPLPERKDTLQFAWYHSKRGAPASPQVMLRYRLSVSRQQIDTTATYLDTDHFAERLHGHDQSIGIDADTYFRIGGHDVFGAFVVAHSRRAGTVKDESRNEVAYVSRFPGRKIRKVFLRATLSVGGVTGRGSNGLNVVSPAFEAFFHDWTTKANIHLIWSPLAMRDGKGWTTHHQIAITVDRALFIHLFSPPAVAVHDLH
jgi:hypothetical protein